MCSDRVDLGANCMRDAFPLEMPIVLNLARSVGSFARAARQLPKDIFLTSLYTVSTVMSSTWLEIVSTFHRHGNSTPGLGLHRGLLEQYNIMNQSMNKAFSLAVLHEAHYHHRVHQSPLPPNFPADFNPEGTLETILNELGEIITTYDRWETPVGASSGLPQLPYL